MDCSITKRLLKLILTAFLSLGIITFSLTFPNKSVFAAIATESNLKVAFIGDSGAGSNFQMVLDIIKGEGVDLVLHQGDFSYNGTSTFINRIDSTLGTNFPYLGSVGNHDTNNWGDIRSACTTSTWAGYFRCKLDRMGISSVPTSGGEQYSVTYKGLKMVFVNENGGSSGANWINQQLSGDDHVWKICSWHKNQNAMQVGGKGNSVGWQVYENCRDQGAIIATGHEHSYERTKTLTDMTNQTVDSSCSNPNNLCIEPGRTFAFVSGLGGMGIRNQDRCLPTTYPYGCKGEWAKIYTSDQGAKHGALFIEFNINGNPNRAHGYFKNINGQIIDDFYLTKGGTPQLTSPPISPTNTPTPPSPTSTPPTTGDLVFSPTDDATIKNDSPSSNYGSLTRLETDNSPIQHFLLKFNVSGIGSNKVSSAKLRLYNIDPSDKGGDFRIVSNNSWSESSVTYSNAPSAGSQILTSLGSVSSGNWYEVDISPFVQGDGTYSLRVTSSSTNGADYYSKEQGTTYAPKLIVNLSGDPIPSPSPTVQPTQAPTSGPSATSVPPGSSNNVLINPSFEDGSEPWVMNNVGGDVTYSVVTPGSSGNYSAKLSVANPGTQLQFYQSGIPLEDNTQYTLFFDAYSNTGHDLSVFVHEHDEDFTNYGLYGHQVDLSTSWQPYSVTFTTKNCLGGVNDARLRFWFGPFDESGDEYFLDNVVLMKTQGPSPSKPGDANYDGRVDGIDYVIWLLHFGITTQNGSFDGDFNGDTKVDGIDYVIWLNNYDFPS